MKDILTWFCKVQGCIPSSLWGKDPCLARAVLNVDQRPVKRLIDVTMSLLSSLNNIQFSRTLIKQHAAYNFSYKSASHRGPT